MVAALGSLGALLGFSIRALVDWLARRMRNPGRAGWPPVWAIAGLLAVAAALDWWMKSRRRPSRSRPEEGGPSVG